MEPSPKSANASHHLLQCVFLALLACQAGPAQSATASHLQADCSALNGATQPLTTNTDSSTPADKQWKIGNIELKRGDVFSHQSSGEGLWIHRLANQLHRETHESVILSQLLFQQGDAYEPAKLAETERNLRSNPYLRMAEVRPIRVCGNAVDVLVRTGDNWSLIPSFTFDRAGGENRFVFKFSELNLFGLGKELNIAYDTSPQRDQTVLHYHDPQLLGSRTQLSAQLQDNSDGEVQFINVELPFYALDTNRAWQFTFANRIYQNSLYQQGHQVSKLDVEHVTMNLNWGFKSSQQHSRVTRWRFGLEYSKKLLANSANDQNSTPTAERLFINPFISMEFLDAQYLKTKNLKVMESDEDVLLGHHFEGQIGYASTAWGSTDNALLFSTQYSKGWQATPKILTLAKLSANGRVLESRTEQLITKLSANVYYFQSRKQSFIFNAHYTTGNNLDEDTQLVLGGDTGLRGYPLRYQSGNQRWVFSAEQRYFFDWYPLSLARIGGAAFVDIGSSWQNHSEQKWLSDVGVGLRLVSTRQAGAKVLHIDIALPLNAPDNIDQLQLLVKAKSEF